MKKKYYTIKDAAKRLGLSKQTLVRYEKKGILSKIRRNPINRWREYTENDIKRLKSMLGRL